MIVCYYFSSQVFKEEKIYYKILKYIYIHSLDKGGIMIKNVSEQRNYKQLLIFSCVELLVMDFSV